jgi:multicomponent Na+:H+ antiporter subunit D
MCYNSVNIANILKGVRILYLALLPVFAPIVVSPLLLVLSGRWRRIMLIFYLCGLFAVAVHILSGAELGSVSLLTSTFEGSNGIAPLFFSEHPYGKIAAFGFLFVGAFALLYGLDVLKSSEQAVSLVAIGSAAGIALAGNFLTLFIFWEFLTISVGGLILLKGTPQAVRMGYRFILFQLGGGLMLFLGIMQHYAATGSLLLTIPEAGLPFFLLGIGIKAVFLPLHVWLPWSYPSASFASSVVLAGLTTKVGVFAVARLLPAHNGIVLMGACMAIFGASFALLQSDLRRLLSYHIISQVGFMVAGIGLGTYLSIDGGLLHMVNHMLYKALLFMSAGAIIYSTGKEDLHDLRPQEKEGKTLLPVWKSVWIGMIGAVIGALAISGTPPFNGFVSKYLLKKAMQGAGPAEWMLWLAGVGTSISFCKFVYFGFIKGKAKAYRRLTTSMNAAILAVSACCLLFGIRPGLLSSLLPHHSSLHVYSWAGAWASLQIILTGVAVFILIAKVLERGVCLPHWLSVEYLLYSPIISMAVEAYTYAGRIVELGVDGAMVRVIPYLFAFSRKVAYFDERTVSVIGGGVAESSVRVREGIYANLRRGMLRFYWRIRAMLHRFFSLLIKVDYDPRGEGPYQLFNVMNFDFDFVLFMITLLVVLGVSIFIF